MTIRTVLNILSVNHTAGHLRSQQPRRQRQAPTKPLTSETGDCLQNKVFELRADLLVRGGSVIRALREYVLGGTTGAVQTNILLSH
ncbi:UNVERIFIED_ORG: nucleotide-binding universal stress UspA family protein [Rhizobium esperanzae]|nr:hypothetical protein RHECNPAF_2970015 [Rhizobium etli CNPAF512]